LLPVRVLELERLPFQAEPGRSYPEPARTGMPGLAGTTIPAGFDASASSSAAGPGDARYDLILLGEVLEHFNFQPVPTLRRLASHLAPCGSIVVTTPNGLSEEWLASEAMYRGLPQYRESYRLMPAPGTPGTVVQQDLHVHLFRPEEVAELADDAGMVVGRLRVGKQLAFELRNRDDGCHSAEGKAAAGTGAQLRAAAGAGSTRDGGVAA